MLETAVYWAFIFSAFLAIGQFVAEVRPLHTREKISIHHRGLKHHFTVQHRAA